jgi:hypothetical protein
MVCVSLEAERKSAPQLLKETAMIRFTKTIAAIATAATLGLGLAASTATPAAAWGFGWGYHHPLGVGAAIGLGVAAAAGAAAVASGPYYGGCYVSRETVRDVYGNYLYSRPVRVCD